MPSHSSKDFVEHLRAVHFALIGLSLGLILITAKPYNPITALRQMEQILELKKIWSPTWLHKNGSSLLQHFQNLCSVELQRHMRYLNTNFAACYGLNDVSNFATKFAPVIETDQNCEPT